MRADFKEIWDNADKRLRTCSDIGGVRIGNADFSVNMFNGLGDGTTHVCIFNQRMPREFESSLRFNTTVKGSFNIYGYDCSEGDESLRCKLEGRYGVYYADNRFSFCEGASMVVFEKWED